MPVSAKGRCGRKIVTGPENHEKWEHWRPPTRRYELEPCAVKVARTVLRGEWHSDVLLLPDRVMILFRDRDVVFSVSLFACAATIKVGCLSQHV